MTKNLVGLATDGANVMIGKKNSFAQRVKSIKPGIHSIHCLSHIGNLIAKKAPKANPKSTMILLDQIHSYFSQSSIKNDSFLKFQRSSNPLSILAPEPTRWSGLKCSIDRILGLWDI